VCQGAGFSPRILHEVRSVATQVAFVGCGQGIALVPAALKRVAPDSVVFKVLTRSVDVVTTAAAWSASATNPAVALAVETLLERTKAAR
jgi:DNA-binding transcriptional LysR family regulator